MSIRVDTSGLDDFIKALEKAQVDTKEACIHAVDKAAPILKEALQSEITKAANKTDRYGKRYSTGALAESISAMDVRENEYGVFTAVGPQGTDHKGVSNEDKLLWLENGVMRKGKNLMKRAGPIRTRAKNAAQARCESTMQQEIEGFLDDTFGG